MPFPKKKSDLPVGAGIPYDLTEAAELLDRNLTLGNAGMFRPMPTGLTGIDTALGGGLHAGDLAILAGVQNIGKTAAVIQFASSFASSDALVIIVEYEHTVTHVLERLLIQNSYVTGFGGQSFNQDQLHAAYIDTILERENLNIHNDLSYRSFNKMLSRLPNGVVAWNRLARIQRNIWIIQGNGSITTPDVLTAYVEMAKHYAESRRILLIVDYLQRVPVIGFQRQLTTEERVEYVFHYLKAMSLQCQDQGWVVPVLGVAAIEADALRAGRVHNYAEKLSPDIFDDFSPIAKRSSMEKLNHYTEDDMLKIAELKPKSTNDLRNIAAFLFLYISGIRIAAFLSLPIKDVFIDERFIVQDPSNGTYTKLNKSGETILLDCPEIMKVVKQWDDIVRANCPPDSTWFARLDAKHEFNPKVIQHLDRRDPKTYQEARSNYKNFIRIMKALCIRAGIKYLSPHKGRYGNIHKWMETIETMEERQALANNSLHTLAVLENTYARMSGTEAKSVMRKLATKSGGEDTATAKKTQSHPNILPGNRNSIYLDDLPDYVQQTIITLVNNTSQ